MLKAFQSFTVAVIVSLSSPAPAQILINEVHGFGTSANPALPGDYLELWNQGSSPVDLTGWTIGTWVGDTGAVTTRVIPCTPAGNHIIPGNCFWILQESGTLGDPLTGSLAGLNGMRGLPTTWSSSSNIGAYLLDPGGMCVDYAYLRRGTTAPPATPPNLVAPCTFALGNLGTTGTGFAHIQRLTNTDTDSFADWAQDATANAGTPGAINTTGGATQASLGACVPGAAATPAWETNSPEARLSLNNVENTAFSGPIDVTACVGQNTTLLIESTLAGNGWDLCYTTATALAGSTLCAPGAGFNTSNGQVINVDFNAPDFACINNFSFPPFPGNQSYGIVVNSPLPNLTAQMVVLDGAHPDGLRLSAAVQLHVVGAGAQALALTDDSSAIVTFAGPPVCGPASFTFCGTAYTQAAVISNGRVMFGTPDTDFTATVAEAMADNPFVGHWTDMNPTLGGTITFSNAGSGILRIDWAGVPYFGEAGTANTFGVSLDTNNGSVTIDGLQGIQPNPATGLVTSAVGDAAFLGLSCGAPGGATNGGATVFSSGGGGCPIMATDMVYDFIGSGATPPVIVPSLAGTSTLTAVTFTPQIGGGYCWTGS